MDEEKEIEELEPKEKAESRYKNLMPRTAMANITKRDKEKILEVKEKTKDKEKLEPVYQMTEDERKKIIEEFKNYNPPKQKHSILKIIAVIEITIIIFLLIFYQLFGVLDVCEHENNMERRYYENRDGGVRK